jgi:uncharacterized protein (TIGR02466 family)
MAQILRLFPTQIYQAKIGGKTATRLNKDLETACLSIARDDRAGQNWCKENNYAGYTSYASLNDLPERSPQIADLTKVLQTHIDNFAETLQFDLGKRKLRMDSIWINVLKPGGVHTGHIHPNCIISGTYYVAVPARASALKFEDPRLPMMMATPAKKANAPPDGQPFVYVNPEPGGIILFESWLRHEVPANQARENRISISFNYA